MLKRNYHLFLCTPRYLFLTQLLLLTKIIKIIVVTAMSLRVRTQEAEGHLCILSRELNQGLKMTSPASIPGSQVSGWKSCSLGYWGRGNPQHHKGSKTAWGVGWDCYWPSLVTASIKLTRAGSSPPSFSTCNPATENDGLPMWQRTQALRACGFQTQCSEIARWGGHGQPGTVWILCLMVQIWPPQESKVTHCYCLDT